MKKYLPCSKTFAGRHVHLSVTGHPHEKTVPVHPRDLELLHQLQDVPLSRVYAVRGWANCPSPRQWSAWPAASLRARSSREWLKRVAPKDITRDIARMMLNMEHQVMRTSSVVTVRRGLRDYGTFAPEHFLAPLPRMDVDLLEYITHAVHFRVPTLDASTVTNYVGSVNTYMAALAHNDNTNAWSEQPPN